LPELSDGTLATMMPRCFAAAMSISAGHAAESLAGFDALIPGMCKVDAALLATADRLATEFRHRIGIA
jgi:hypothetical protein